MTTSIELHHLPRERREKIQHILMRDGRIVIQDIVRDFAVSEDTVRRDLKELESAGLCACVYGGALLVTAQSSDVNQRRGLAVGRKERLGAALAGLIEPGQVVFMDAGTTNLAAAQLMQDLKDVTVITHDPAIAAALVPCQNIKLISIGGKINRSVGAALDAAAMRQIKKVRPDLLILGSCVLDASLGLAAFSFEDAEIKSMLVENAREVASGLLNEKFHASAPYGICEISAVNTLVLEANVTDVDLEMCKLKVPRVVLAKPTATGH